MSEKLRADVALVQRGLCESREKAQAQIMAGNVFVGLRKINKASEPVFENDDLNLKVQDKPFVSRGGKKLEKAIQVFSGSVKDAVAMDIGVAKLKAATNKELVILPETVITEKYGIGFKKGNTALRDAVQKTLKT